MARPLPPVETRSKSSLSSVRSRTETKAYSFLAGLAEDLLCAAHRVDKGVGFCLVGDGLLWSTHAPWGWRVHRRTPTVRASVEPALARRGGTWKDPTRISLGPRSHGVNLRGMVCDLAVAHSAVNVDRCSPCSLAIVISTLRSTTGCTVECTQCCHFSTYTRRNRQVPVSEPPMPSRRARVQPRVEPDRRTASLNPTRTAANAENSRGEH